MATTTARTDVHRPSAPGFDPEAYDCRGVFDTHPEESSPLERRAHAAIVGGLRAQGIREATHTRGGGYRCGHCGARLRFVALMVRADVAEFIYVGQECLANRFDALTAGEFKRLRETATLNRERIRKADRIAALCDTHPDLAWVSYRANLAETGDVRVPSFVDDVAYRLERYGDLSERQIGAVSAAMIRAMDRANEYAAKRAADATDAADAPTGRVTFRGTVLAVKSYESQYGTTWKMLVRVPTAGGAWKAWTTIPASIDPDRGDTVELTATVTPADDDPAFGKCARPTKARIVATAEGGDA